MSSIDQQFVEYVVKSLVSKPDAVKVDRRIDEKGVLLELTVDPEDLGRVIGKRGATAQSIRTLLRALGTKNDARYNLKIIDNGMPPPRDRSSSDNYGYQPASDNYGGSTATNDRTDTDTTSEAEPEPETEAPRQETEPAEQETEPAPESETEPDKGRLDRIREELGDLDD